MRDEDYNIRSFERLPERIMPNGQLVFDMFTPTLYDRKDVGLSQYIVPEFEAGRIDLVLTSLYGDDNLMNSYSRLDALLYINGIDNPLNIYDGMVILYPPEAVDLDSYRYDKTSDPTGKREKNNSLGIPNSVPNKSTRVDTKRRKYLDSVSLPPTVNKVPQPGVRIEGNSIIIGGIN